MTPRQLSILILYPSAIFQLISCGANTNHSFSAQARYKTL